MIFTRSKKSIIIKKKNFWQRKENQASHIILTKKGTSKTKMNLPNNMIIVDGAMKFAADPKSVLLNTARYKR